MTVAGIGINDANYITNKYSKIGGKIKLVWRCPYYNTWSRMLNRCYGNSASPQYKDVEVCTEWLTFSNFKSWMEEQDWKDKELDKDLFGDGSIYSPDSCCFIPAHLNTLITEIRKNNTTGIPNIQPLNNGFCVGVSTKNGLLTKSFPTLQEAINFWIDLKISIVASYENVVIRDRFLDRYEKLRNYYLSETKCSLHDKQVTPETIENFKKRREKIKIGDVLVSKNGYTYKIIDIVGGNAIIQFENGKEKVVPISRVKQGAVVFTKADGKPDKLPRLISTQIKKLTSLNKYGYLVGVYRSGKFYCAAWERKIEYFKTKKEAESYIKQRRIDRILELCYTFNVDFESLNISKDG